MNIPLIVKEFVKRVKDKNIVAIGGFGGDSEFIKEFIKYLKDTKKKVYFIPTTSKQAKEFHDLEQDMISLNDKEIDIAIEFVDQVDSYYNFAKRRTKSFVRDKMISQSALNLIVVTDHFNVVDDINIDIYVEISTFAWQRTIINLQSYGLARVVKDNNDNFVKTEIGHYLARVTLDKHISLEDFEYHVRTIPGVFETGLFLGLADTLFIYNEEKDELKVRSRSKI
jgi:ribose 5-phosphate isomerase A